MIVLSRSKNAASAAHGASLPERPTDVAGAPPHDGCVQAGALQHRTATVGTSGRVRARVQLDPPELNRRRPPPIPPGGGRPASPRRHVARHLAPRPRASGGPLLSGFHNAPTETAAATFREPSCPHRSGLSTAHMILSRSGLDTAILNGIAPTEGAPIRDGETTMTLHRTGQHRAGRPTVRQRTTRRPTTRGHHDRPPTGRPRLRGLLRGRPTARPPPPRRWAVCRWAARARVGPGPLPENRPRRSPIRAAAGS